MAKAASSLLAGLNIPEVVKGLRAEYVRSATTQTLVVDLFLVYILATGLLQMVYCALVGTFPFNSFLSGFLSCVGMFALTVSLRLQVSSDSSKGTERAFGEYVFSCLLLFLVVMNFLG